LDTLPLETTATMPIEERSMKITDAIRFADSEHAVYFLLTNYVESLQFSQRLPECLIALPLAGPNDVRLRLDKLVVYYESQIRLMDNSACDVAGEALEVFDAAVRRLNNLCSEPFQFGERHPRFTTRRETDHA
jgi:hypothetical protein